VFRRCIAGHIDRLICISWLGCPGCTFADFPAWRRRRKTFLAFHSEQRKPISVQKSSDPPPLSVNMRNIKHSFTLSDNMSSIHHTGTTKTESHSFDAPIIEDLSSLSSLDLQSQSWRKSNRDSFANISLSRDGATKRSLPNARQLPAIL
jgi:hypothetical protein